MKLNDESDGLREIRVEELEKAAEWIHCEITVKKERKIKLRKEIWSE